MLLAACLALAADTADYHAAQARVFVKKGWLADADSEVRAGLALDPDHLDLNALCVELAQRAVDLDRALACAARGAAAPTGNTDTRAALSQLEAFYRENYGWIEIRGPEGVHRAPATLSPPGLLLDAELKRAATVVAERAAKGLELPARVGVPTGDWTVSGRPTRVEPGQVAVVELGVDAFAANAGRGPRFEAAVGGVAYAGAPVDNFHPGAVLEVGASVPAGPLRVGAAFSWEARSYSVVNGPDQASPYTFGGALRLGADVDLGGALVFSPAAAAYAVMMPGLELGCDDGGENAADDAGSDARLACTLGHPGAGQTPVYATGGAVAPAVDLGLNYRSGRLLIGVRGTAAYVLGQAPSPGRVSDDDGTRAFDVADPAYEGLRVVFAGVLGLGV